MLNEKISQSPNGRTPSRRGDLLIAGGGLGGVAAALAATEAGLRVVLTEETDWLGGQMTSQAVPPDEHGWIEQFGRTRRYGEFRERVRDYYRRNFPLTHAARANKTLNPGGGTVSKLCHLPAVSAAVLEEMLAPAQGAGLLTIYYHAVPVAAEAEGGRVRSVRFLDQRTGHEFEIEAPWFIDATELGDLLPMAGVEWVTGAESRDDTGELHALDGPADPEDTQAITWCFPLAYDPDCHESREGYYIDQPKDYAFWRDYTPSLTPPWPGKLLGLPYSSPKTCLPVEFPIFPDEREPEKWCLWRYRQILSSSIFDTPRPWHEVTLVNWPQNDFFEESIIGRTSDRKQQLLEGARQLSLSFAHWLQNEAPRPDGGRGYHGLHLRPDITGTHDGLAKAPYIREARRIKALFRVTEGHIGTDAREGRWPELFPDSVGVGSYRMDLHPGTGKRNYIDIGCFPFQIPLGALIPRATENLLAGAKNIGSTHITNGCYRLHPVEWNIGEAAGSLIAFCLQHAKKPSEVWENTALRADYQRYLVHQGVELQWPVLYAR